MAENKADDLARLQDMAMVRMLLTERVVAFNPVISEITKDVKATLFLCQLMYWSDKGDDERGWIYKTREEWQRETSMGRREQESARAKLRTLHLIEEHQRGTNRVLYYRVQWESLHERLKAVSQRYKSAQSKGQKTVPIEGSDSAPSIEETETTTETPQIFVSSHFPWLGILRTIPGWEQHGEPLVKPLVVWSEDKGHSDDFLYDHAVGVASQKAKALKGTNLARKFQNACRAGWYARVNGSGPPVTDDDRLESIRKAKNA